VSPDTLDRFEIVVHRKGGGFPRPTILLFIPQVFQAFFELNVGFLFLIGQRTLRKLILMTNAAFRIAAVPRILFAESAYLIVTCAINDVWINPDFVGATATILVAVNV